MSETAERFMADERDIEILGSVICEATAPCPACKQLAKDAIERAAPLIAPLRARIEQLEADLIEAEKYNGYHQQACLRIEQLEAALRAFTTHFIVKDGANKDKNQYGHLELWCAGKSVDEEPSALYNPWMMLGNAENSYSLAYMGMLRGAIENARGALNYQQSTPSEK